MSLGLTLARKSEVSARSYAALGRKLPATRSDVILTRSSALSVEMTRIIRPESTYRWLMPSLSAITPTYIEQVLRGGLTGSLIWQWQLFDLMEDTWPRLVKNLNEVKKAVIQRDWKLRPWQEEDTPPTDSAKEKQRLVSNALWKMRPNPSMDENALDGTIYDILDAWGKGTSVLEIEWETREAGALGEITAPRATSWVHPCNYAWDTNGMLGLRREVLEATGAIDYTGPYTTPSANLAQPGNVIPFPDDKFLVSVIKAKSGSPLGGALLRSLAWWWCAANFSGAWLLNLAQIFGLPFRFATYDTQADDATIAKINDMLQNMGSAAWGSFPAGTNIEFKEGANIADNSPQAAVLDRADKGCDLLILGQTLTTSQGHTGGGSLALGRVHEGVREDVIEAAGNAAAGILNQQLIPSILRLNYDDDSEAPEICAVPKEEKDQLSYAQRDAVLLGQGVAMPKKWFYQRHDIPLPAAGEEVIEGGASVPASRDGEGGASVPASRDTAQKDSSLSAKDSTHQLVDRVLEDLGGVQAKWLGGVRPFFIRLVALAESNRVTDAELVLAVEHAQKQIPELFSALDKTALSTALEKAMGAAVVNGALKGHILRKVGRASPRAERVQTARGDARPTEHEGAP